MRNKLKILKDLSWIETDVPSHCLDINHPICCSIMLKEEAIEWIRQLREHRFYCTICDEFDCDCGSSDCFKPRSDGIESWLKHFFDINEDDITIKHPKVEESKEKAKELDWWQEKGKELQKELTNVMKIESDVAREIAERKVQKTIELLCLCKSQRDKDVEIISKLVEGKARLDSRESVIQELEGKFAYTLKGRFTQKSGNYIISKRRWEKFKRGIM